MMTSRQGRRWLLIENLNSEGIYLIPESILRESYIQEEHEGRQEGRIKTVRNKDATTKKQEENQEVQCLEPKGSGYSEEGLGDSG